MRLDGADNGHPASEERGQPAALFLGELPGHLEISLIDKITLLTGADTWHTAAHRGEPRDRTAPADRL